MPIIVPIDGVSSETTEWCAPVLTWGGANTDRGTNVETVFCFGGLGVKPMWKLGGVKSPIPLGELFLTDVQLGSGVTLISSELLMSTGCDALLIDAATIGDAMLSGLSALPSDGLKSTSTLDDDRTESCTK